MFDMPTPLMNLFSSIELSLAITPTLGKFGEVPSAYWLAPVGAVVALVAARLIGASVLKKPEGDSEMIRIAAAVRQGAMAYLARQYRVVGIVFVMLIAALGVLNLLGLQHWLSMIGVPIAGLLSGICGWLGMRMATAASARTAAAAKESLNDGLTVAFRSGAVMGLNVVGFALLDVSVWFFVLLSIGDTLGLRSGLQDMTVIMLSFGMGASTQALFARVGGGIYTKAADVGADLVGKVEAGIPEDDPRNPATIADNVGDNVGDVAGMGADLYESYYGSILAAAALGTASTFAMHHLSPSEMVKHGISLAALPLSLAGSGILASILGIFVVRTKEGASFSDLLKSLHRGVYVASAVIILAAFGIPYLLLGEASIPGMVPWYRFGIAIVAGLVSGLVIAQWTEYCTSYEHPPTRRIATQALTGPATVIIAGIAEGMKSTWASLLAVVVAILVAFVAAGGNENFLLGLYGVSIAAVGMLATLGITLATDAYGPIADNAGGNAEMSGQPPHVRQRTDMLDSLGNTTAATGKGFAIGSAALTAMALLAAYVQVVQTQLHSQCLDIKQGEAVVSNEVVPYAFYGGHGRFRVVYPMHQGHEINYADGALLVDMGQLDGVEHLDDVLTPGQHFFVTGLHATGDELDPEPRRARTYDLQATIGHGAHDHTLKFSVVSTNNATVKDVLEFYDVTLTNPRVLGGLFLGAMVAFLFCALTMSAVGRAAYAMMGECRRQFAIIRKVLRGQGMSESDIANPEMWPKRIQGEGKEYPDYAECVSIATAGAQREMILPSILAVVIPILVGVVLNVPGVIGLLAGALTSGFAVAVFMANAGGAWDNAKKLIESYGMITADDLATDASIREKLPMEVRETLLARAEELRALGKGSTRMYGKGSDDHKATVVGDTVGDPFKDTSGPSLNILIKLLSIVAVVFAGFVVKFGPAVGAMLGFE